jgi:hypothetical protein
VELKKPEYRTISKESWNFERAEKIAKGWNGEWSKLENSYRIVSHGIHLQLTKTQYNQVCTILEEQQAHSEDVRKEYSQQ